MIGSGVGPTMMPESKYNIGIAYVGIPSDIDRKDYLQFCFLSGTVSLRSDGGSFFNRVPIPQWIMNFVEFPDEVGTNGSAVVYVVDELKQLPIVVGILPKVAELSGLEEHQLKVGRLYNNNLTQISFSPRKQYMSLVVDGDKKPELNLTVYSETDNGNTNFFTQGNINLEATKSTNITQSETLNVTTVDANDETQNTLFQQTPSQNYFNNKTFKINSGKEHMVLGDQLVTFLKSFIDQVAAITTTTAIGLQPVVNKVQITALKDNLDKILSQVGSLE